jgi:hypothetical protein
MLATYNSDAGDSGSPVWYVEGNNRWLLGIHHSRVENIRIFSNWMYTQVEFANDILAKTGVQWSPTFSSGPYH